MRARWEPQDPKNERDAMSEAMKPGTRVRVVGGPWPERQGCIGTVLAPPADGMYPQPSKREELVSLDYDPLQPAKPPGSEARYWTCVMRRDDIEALDWSYGAPR